MKIKIAAISFFLVPFLAFAQSTSTLPSAGITPESPFYFFDKIWESVQEFFTFSPEGKARLEISFAAERMAEIRDILQNKGADAKGLEIAKSGLQENLSNAANIIAKQKAEGKDAAEFTKLAKELDDEFEASKTALSDTFKSEKQALEAKIEELKSQIKDARRAGDTAKVDALSQELSKVEAQLELLDNKEGELGNDIDAGENELRNEMDDRAQAEKAIQEAEKQKQEALAAANEKGVTLPANAFAQFDDFIAQAKAAFQAGNYAEAANLAEEASSVLDIIENDIDDEEQKMGDQKDSEEAIKDMGNELAEMQAEAKKEGVAIPAETIAKFNSVIAQAKAALTAGNHEQVQVLADQASEILKEVKNTEGNSGNTGKESGD